jgi:carboxyl-terminal processing protease
MRSAIKCFTLMGITLLIFVSCRKDISSSADNTVSTNFTGVFDQFWNGMNRNYVWWDIDTTDWDAIYNRYRPLFAQMNLQDNEDRKRSIGYFREMTDGLIDSHYSISFTASPILDSFVFPAQDRKIQRSDFHSPFLYMSIDSAYFDKGYVSGSYYSSGNGQISAMCATIHGSILYFNCSGFALQEAYTSAAGNGVKGVLQYFFTVLQTLPANITGMIIDVRNNHGGDLTDLDFLIGHLIDKPLQLGYSRYKSGNGRLSYTPWIAASIIPQTGGKAFRLPIMVLADNYSISLAEAVTMAVHTMPNGKFVGETTWGATGPIVDNALYDDGPFKVSGFLSVYTSSAEFRYIDGKVYEGKGFPPDVTVPFDFGALYGGDDPALDKAISLIH